jgi:polyphosphate glucokinase
MVIDGVAESRELAHIHFKNGRTLEDYVGVHARRRLGKKRWRKHVEKIVSFFVDRIHADDVVFGGGEVKNLKTLPPGCRAGANANAFIGGFRLWEQAPGEKLNAKVLRLNLRKHGKQKGGATNASSKDKKAA